MAGSISFPGIGSGIDGQSIANAIFQQLTVVNTIHQNNISSLQSENSSLDRLRILLLAISDSLDSSRSANGGVSGSKKASSSDATIASAVAGSAATVSTLNLSVTSLASGATGSFNRSYGSKSDFVISDPNQAGDVNFTVGTGADATTFNVSVNELTTVDDFVSQFNDQADGKATASVINVGTDANPDMRIAFHSTETGKDKGTLTIDTTNSALLDSSALGGQTIAQATNAVFQVSGISGNIERESNTVSDVITGLTLKLSGIGSTTITVSNDSAASADKLTSFVSAVNGLVNFLNTEDKITTQQTNDKSANVLGSLVKTSVDDNARGSLRDAISSVRSDDGTTSLAAIGISTQRDGTITFDEKKFSDAFQANPDAVNQVVTNLADKLSGVQGALHQYTGFGLQIDQEMQGNSSQVSQLQDTISKIEQSAKSRQDAVLQQFNSLDRLFARLQSASTYISQLLNF